MENIPGLKFTSCHLFYNRKSQNTAFDCGAVLNPFYQYSEGSANVATKSPIICLTCAGYLSMYALINPDTGEWRCPFCRSVNPRFHSTLSLLHSSMRENFLRDNYSELRSKHFDYHEEASSSSPVLSSFSSGHSAESHFIFAIDACICGDNHLVSLVLAGLKELPASAKVSFIVYGRNLSIFRLGGSVVSPLAVDKLPGDADYSAIFKHLIQRGNFATSAVQAVESFPVIHEGLLALSVHQIRSNSGLGCTIEAIVGLAISLGKASSTTSSVRLILLACRFIPLTGTLNGSRNAVGKYSRGVNGFKNVGKNAFGKGCWIDIFFASNGEGNMDQLDGLASPSGGCIVTGNSYHEASIQQSFLKLFANNRLAKTVTMVSSDVPASSQAAVLSTSSSTSASTSTSYTTTSITTTTEILTSGNTSCAGMTNNENSNTMIMMPTLEIRSCGKLLVDRIVGPIVSIQDVLYHKNCRINENKRKQHYSSSSSSGYMASIVNGSSNSSTIISSMGSEADCEYLTKDAAELTVDASHVSHSMFFVDHDNNNSSSGSSNNASIAAAASTNTSTTATEVGIANMREEIYDRLVKYNQKHTIISGINARCSSSSIKSNSTTSADCSGFNDCMISIQLSPNYNSNDNPNSSYSSLLPFATGISTDSNSANAYTSSEYNTAASRITSRGNNSNIQEQQFGGVLATGNAHTDDSSDSDNNYSMFYYDNNKDNRSSANTNASSRTVYPIYKKRNSIMPGLFGTVAVDNTEEEANEQTTRLDAAYVQFVVRYDQRVTTATTTTTTTSDSSNINTNTTITSNIVKVTRVWTQRVDITDDPEEYLQGLDEYLWGIVISRGIVADYQSDIIEMFGGARRNRLDDQGRYSHAAVKAAAHNDVDDLVRGINMHWLCRALHRPKILTICRMLHHLREGALLDGPCAQPMEAYLLRSIFLKTHYSHALRLLLPSLRLAIASSLQQDDDDAVAKQQQETLKLPSLNRDNVTCRNISTQPQQQINDIHINMTNSSSVVAAVVRMTDILTPDSINLIPGTVAILDCGSSLIIRVNSNNSSSSTSKTNNNSSNPTSGINYNIRINDTSAAATTTITAALYQIADAIARSRYPVPSIHILSQPGTPMDRMIYSRLSPNHMDLKESLIEQLCHHSNNININNKDNNMVTTISPQTNQPTPQQQIQQPMQQQLNQVELSMQQQQIQQILYPPPPPPLLRPTSMKETCVIHNATTASIEGGGVTSEGEGIERGSAGRSEVNPLAYDYCCKRDSIEHRQHMLSLLTLTELLPISPTQLDEMLAFAPITDQYFFEKYIRFTLPTAIANKLIVSMNMLRQQQNNGFYKSKCNNYNNDCSGTNNINAVSNRDANNNNNSHNSVVNKPPASQTMDRDGSGSNSGKEDNSNNKGNTTVKVVVVAAANSPTNITTPPTVLQWGATAVAHSILQLTSNIVNNLLPYTNSPTINTVGDSDSLSAKENLENNFVDNI